MNIMTFTYTKEPSKVSERVFIPLVVPADKYFGIDITELSVHDQVALSEDITNLDLERKSKIDELMAKYDARHAYRSFIPAKMSAIVEED